MTASSWSALCVLAPARLLPCAAISQTRFEVAGYVEDATSARLAGLMVFAQNLRTGLQTATRSMGERFVSGFGGISVPSRSARSRLCTRPWQRRCDRRTSGPLATRVRFGVVDHARLTTNDVGRTESVSPVAARLIEQPGPARLSRRLRCCEGNGRTHPRDRGRRREQIKGGGADPYHSDAFVPGRARVHAT